MGSTIMGHNRCFGTCVVAFLAIVFLAASPANAEIIHLGSTIDGAQETPPVATPATGSATLEYDTATRVLSWNIIYANLIGSISASHFHGPAAVGVNAGVALNIGALASPMIGSADFDTVFGVNAATREAELLGQLWYINIHSTFKPGGEIRGQVVPIPEPSTLVLATLGGIGLLVAGWRRRRSR